MSYSVLPGGEDPQEYSGGPSESPVSPHLSKGLHTAAGMGNSVVSTRAHSPLGASATGPFGEESVAAEAMGETSVRTAINESDDENESEGWGHPKEVPKPRKLFSFEAARDACSTARRKAPEQAMRVLAAVASAVSDLPETCRDTWNMMHHSLVDATAALREAVGLERLVIGMHVSVAAISLLFCSISSLLLGVSPRVPAIHLFCGAPLLGAPLGVCIWALARLHTKASYRLYWPIDYISFRPSIGIRVLQLGLQFCFSMASLGCWVAAFLFLGNTFSFSSLSFAVPIVCLCRLGFKALLQLISIYLSDYAVTGLGASDVGGPEGGFLWKKFAKCWSPSDWMNWLGALPDFYGPVDVSRRPVSADMAFYLGGPLRSEGEEALYEGSSTFGEPRQQQRGAPPVAAAQRLLTHENSEISGGATSAAEEIVRPLEDAAEECAAFLGLPGGGATLARSCCYVAAAIESFLLFLYMCLDGTLAFLSLGGLTLLCGSRLPAGMLLSGAPLYAATCALSAGLMTAAKHILFSLLCTAECNGGRLGVSDGIYEGPCEQGGASNTWKRLQEALETADPLAMFRNRYGSSSRAEKQQQLLQRLRTGDVEAGNLQDFHHTQNQEEHPLGPVEAVPALSASSSSGSKSMNDLEDYRKAHSDAHPEDLDEGNQALQNPKGVST